MVVKGQAKVQVGEDFHLLHKSQSVYIPIGVLHRMENVGDEWLNLLKHKLVII